jgi:hypothetical protein
MSSATPTRVTAMRGRITKGPYGKGSKSEREAVFIETVDARYILRRKSGPAFDDTKLMQYLGHEVECDGFLVGMTLLAERIDVVDD